MKFTTGMTVNSEDAAELIEKFGISIVIGLDQTIDVKSSIEPDDRFQLIVNYGHGVQLVLEQDDKNNPVIIELSSLKGSCIDGEWCAVVD